MQNKLPFHVRATDVVHRLAVVGIVGFCLVGIGGISFNIFANSDYAPWNKKKLKFEPAQYEDARKQEDATNAAEST
ncbi:hypothetical protein JNB11_03750 [Kocuria palustris]|nr:hypothetical protein [Kocuria palustris]